MSVLSIPASFHDTPPRGGRTASAPPAPVYRFRDCEVRAGTRDILADGVAQHIEPRAFDALVHLIEHRDRIVTKHELLRSVWGRVEVSDSVVARSIMKVRAAIGDHDGSAPLIRTAHRVGYRFVGEVEAVQERAVAAGEPVRVALLPFVNLTGRAELGWIELGLMSQVAGLLLAETGIVLAPTASTLMAVERAGRLGPLPRAREVRAALNVGVAVLVEVAASVDGFQARCTVVGMSGAESLPPLHGSGPEVLAECLSRTLRSALAPARDAVPRPTGSADDVNAAFAAEARARAGWAMAQQDWSRALPLLRVLAQQQPHDMQLQLRLLRGLAALSDPAAPRTAQRLLRDARVSGDRRLEAAVLQEQARLALYSGRYGDSEAHLAAALAQADCCDDVQVCANLLLRAATALHRRDLPAARCHLEAARGLADRSDNRTLQANWRNCAALLDFRTGNLEGAERLVEESLAIARPAGLRICVAVGRWACARIRASLGTLGRAAALAREALELALPLRDGPRIAEIGLTAALLLGESRQADAGRDVLRLLEAHICHDPALHADLLTLARTLIDPEGANADFAAACERCHHLLLCCDAWPAAALALQGAGRDAQALLLPIPALAEATGDADLRCGLAYVDGCSALGAGDRALARRCFAAAADETLPSLWRARASLEGAWLAVEDGELAAAARLLLIAGHCAQEHPAGLRVTARLQQESGEHKVRVTLDPSGGRQ